jgi:CRP/FNR family transcriptional activator FtrB
LRAADAQIVRELPLFADVAAEEFGALMQAALLQRFPAQVQLISEGEQADFLHIVVEGMVEMFATDGGRETTIGFIAPVSTFILAAVVVDKVYLQSARTLQPSRILMIPAEAIRAVFARDGAFARAVVNELAERYRDVVRELKDQKVRSGLERLAAWIIRNGAIQGGVLTTTIPYEKLKLASFLGMTRESLSRSFANLEEHGVAVRGRAIVCQDLPALIALAKPNTLIDEQRS